MYLVIYGSGKVTKTEMHLVYWKNKAKYMPYLEGVNDFFLIKK